MIIHHFGVACSDLRGTLEQVRKLFPVSDCSEIVHDAEQNADLCLVAVEGSPPLELISGPVVENLVRKGIMLYHICWEVDDMETALARLCDGGCLIVSSPKPAILFDFRRVAFLRSPIGLIEILEKDRKKLKS